MNNQEQITSIINEAKQLIPADLLPDLPMDLEIKTYAWHGFELKIWELGEAIRQIFNADKASAREESFLSDIVSIATNRKAKRGRQSFILLLGKKQYKQYAPAIISQIDDEEVSGQVISTLNKMKAFDYVKEVKRFCENKKTWIKREVMKYLKNAENVNN